MEQALSETTSMALPEPGSAIDMEPHAEPSMLRGAEFTTPSGRIELYSEAMEQRCGEGVPRFKPLIRSGEFILVTPASEQRINSTFGGLSSQQSDLCCEIHPEDATRHGVTDGDMLELHNEQGRLQIPAQVLWGNQHSRCAINGSKSSLHRDIQKNWIDFNQQEESKLFFITYSTKCG